MSLIELLGIIENSKALNTVGTFLRWYEILALAGIVFAISEFMGHSKLVTIFLNGVIYQNIF